MVAAPHPRGTGRFLPALAARARFHLRDDASRTWGVRPGLAEALFVLPLVGGLAVAAVAKVDYGAYLFLVTEDSLLEWVQFAAFLGACVFALLVARRRRQAGDGLGALAFLAVAVGLFLVAGEEISWGQRLLGFETPPRLSESNLQDEANVHNIAVVRLTLKLVAIAVGLAGLALPWLARTRGWKRTTFMPPLFLTSGFFVILTYNLTRLALYPEDFVRGGTRGNLTLLFFGEWTETCLAFIAFTFAFLLWRRGSPARPAAARAA